MEINYNDIPVDKELYKIADLANIDPFKWAFFGGEDYELIGTVTGQDFEDIKQQGIPVKTIGKVISSNNNPAIYVKIDSKVIEINSQSLNKEVFSHFKEV
jgi:thiamine-monophosphate kinase